MRSEAIGVRSSCETAATKSVRSALSCRARLIRAKYYEIEEFDTATQQSVNRRTVVDSDVAVPQTPDADAVALGKVVGQTPDGKPILEQLSAGEKRFFNDRYKRATLKARQDGRLPDAAEHGVTLMGDDLSANLAGKVIPKFGAPFLPEPRSLMFQGRSCNFLRIPGTSQGRKEGRWKRVRTRRA